MLESDIEIIFFVFCLAYLLIGWAYFIIGSGDIFFIFTGIPRGKISKPYAAWIIGWFAICAAIVMSRSSAIRDELHSAYFLFIILYAALGVLYSAIKEDNLFRMFTTLKWGQLSNLHIAFGVGQVCLIAGWWIVLNAR